MSNLKLGRRQALRASGVPSPGLIAGSAAGRANGQAGAGGENSGGRLGRRGAGAGGVRAIRDTGFIGYIAHEFSPRRGEPQRSLAEAVDLCAGA